MTNTIGSLFNALSSSANTQNSQATTQAGNGGFFAEFFVDASATESVSTDSNGCTKDVTTETGTIGCLWTAGYPNPLQNDYTSAFESITNFSSSNVSAPSDSDTASSLGVLLKKLQQDLKVLENGLFNFASQQMASNKTTLPTYTNHTHAESNKSAKTSATAGATTQPHKTNYSSVSTVVAIAEASESFTITETVTTTSGNTALV